MGKNELDKNFENLKAQMMKKKDMVKKHDQNINNVEPVYKEEIESNVDCSSVAEVEVNQSAPRIVIKKQEKQDIPKRITYYLNNSTIKKIDKCSKAAGMGKSAFVQTLLDIALENLEIE